MRQVLQILHYLKHARMLDMPYVIEFRNGRYFQSLESEQSGPLATAQTFKTKEAADQFMRQHEWIVFNGGIVTPKPTPAQLQRDIDRIFEREPLPLRRVYRPRKGWD